VRGLRLSKSDVDPILDRSERSMIERALAWLRSTQPRDSAVLWAQVKRVAWIGEVLDETPSLLVASTLGNTERDAATVVHDLVHLDPMAGDLVLPEKAHFARAFLLAKIALLRGFEIALAPGAVGAEPGLHREVRAEVSQSVYTLIATEILGGLLGDPGVNEFTRSRAARQLILLWERAAQLEIDDFCPMLEAAWRARSRVAVHFGALLGAGEYMRLVSSDCPAEFLDYFAREGIEESELQSFEEFLFNVPYEDLVKLRAAAAAGERKVVDLNRAAEILGRSLDEAVTIDDPNALYRSYRRRSIAAELRRQTGAPGPRRTAEACIMVLVLERWNATAEYPVPRS
jgi:hypothetical protein